MRKHRYISIVVGAVLAAGALVSPAATSTTAGGANNVVLAKTTGFEATATQTRAQVAPVGAPTVASANIASALSTDCTGCRTVAVAFQAVLVTGDPHTFTPANAATAVNAGCHSCATYAYAYQYVVSTGGPVRISTSGRAQLGDIQRRIDAVARSTASFWTLTEELDELAAEFSSVIDSESIAAGQRPVGVGRTSVDRDG
jgi:hypothetical protein